MKAFFAVLYESLYWSVSSFFGAAATLGTFGAALAFALHLALAFALGLPLLCSGPLANSTLAGRLEAAKCFCR